MFELMDASRQSAVIKVIGVGGGGGNAVSHMISTGIDGVDFICANTDAQALQNSKVKTALQIGCNITKGLGAGANPDIGRNSAMEDRDRIQEVIGGADMLFITAGMGGGTGTGAAPVVAQVAKELGILTVAVVTKPFSFEGSKRMQIAERGIEELRGYVDSLITIPNQKLLSVHGDLSLLDAFKEANSVLQGAVQGIAELITRPGLINVDFADVRTVMSEMGMAMMGAGEGQGENRAQIAAQQAVSSPLLEDINISGAQGVLVNVTAGADLSIREFEEVGSTIREYSSDDATVVIGTAIDESMSGKLRVTVVATGLGEAAPSLKLVEPRRNSYMPPAQARVEQKPLQPQVNMRDREIANERPNYDEYDIPAVTRQQRAVGSDIIPEMPSEEFLDIPAFLRKQAD